MKLSTRIQNHAEATGSTVEEILKKAGLSHANYYNWANGQTPRETSYQKVMKVINGKVEVKSDHDLILRIVKSNLTNEDKVTLIQKL